MGHHWRVTSDKRQGRGVQTATCVFSSSGLGLQGHFGGVAQHVQK